MSLGEKLHLVDRLRAFRDSFIMVPSIFIVCGIGLSLILVALDQAMGYGPADATLLFFTVGPEGARGILSSIASTVLSVATMAFSITISVMSSASSSFGPRLVRNFMSDRGNQVVLGTFTSTFLYCLLVMRSVQGADNSVSGQSFVPHIAVNFSMVLALACVGVLIYFINHIASGIQVSTIATTVQSKYLKLIDRNNEFGEKGSATCVRQDERSNWPYSYPVCTSDSGYVVDIEPVVLAEKTKDSQAFVSLLVRAGDHLVEGQRIAWIFSDTELEPETLEKMKSDVQAICSLGDSRTDYNDIRFVQGQIVELGVRALSPGTNDPFTLTDSTHELTVGLVRAAQQPPAPNTVICDGRACVGYLPVEAAELIDLVFDSFRSYALDHEQCLIDLLKMAGKIICLGSDQQATARARWHAAVIVEYFRATEPLPHSLDLVLSAYDRYIVQQQF